MRFLRGILDGHVVITRKIAELLLIARTFLADTLAAQRDQLDAVGSLPPIGTSR